MTDRAFTGDRTVKRLTLEWEAVDDLSEQAIAHEVTSAFSSLTGSWLEPLALELRVGCYDREIFTESFAANSARPAQPYHLIVREPKSAQVEISPMYHVIETGVPSLTSHVIESWASRAIAQSCGDVDRYETSLREFALRASRILLPPSCADGDELLVECYAGVIRVPVVRVGETAWIDGPPTPYGLHQPVELKVTNRDGGLQFSIDIYWSPWAQELDRPGSPLAEGIARLVARRWSSLSG